MRVPQDVAIGAVMLCVAALFWWEADKIRISPLDGPVGAAGLPKTLAWALGVLAVILIVRSLALAALARRNMVAVDTPRVSIDWRPHMRAIGMLAIGVGYLLIVDHVGYVVAVALLLLVVSLYIGARASLRTFLFAGLGAVFFYFLFVMFLGIPLPAGLVENLFGVE